jgi:hypothetical protein
MISVLLNPHLEAWTSRYYLHHSQLWRAARPLSLIYVRDMLILFDPSFSGGFGRKAVRNLRDLARAVDFDLELGAELENSICCVCHGGSIPDSGVRPSPDKVLL